MEADHALQHSSGGDERRLRENARRTLVVCVVTAAIMGLEVAAGFASGSMALLADGWHMGSHVVAFAIAWGAYRVATSASMRKHFTFGGGKILALGGYTSAILLALIGLATALESVTRVVSPVRIDYREALIVTTVGLLANIIGAVVLGRGHQHVGHSHSHEGKEHHHEDPNMRSAYMHVLADLATSVLALIALSLGAWKSWSFLDPIAGIVGAMFILRWSYTLIRDSGAELLDAHAPHVPMKELSDAVEALGAEILDIHVWKIGAGATACELVLRTPTARGSEYYRKRLATQFAIGHLVLEERVVP